MSRPQSPPELAPLSRGIIVAAAVNALAEDLGLSGDITTAATVPADADARSVLATREPGVIAGLDVAREVFAQVDPAIQFNAKARDGTLIRPGTVIAEISGPARGILAGERSALNFLCHMSGIATLTRRFVVEVADTGVAIVCTRKTTPGLRAFEKYAVRAGGGRNHRFGLFDAVLIKDNHIAAVGGVAEAIAVARASAGHTVKLEVEVATLDELDLALAVDPDIVMLDNMDIETLAEAVRRCAGKVLTEASGGVTLETVRDIAQTGVDMISVGRLTHSAPALDVGLDFV